jgi:hypothetical protein
MSGELEALLTQLASKDAVPQVRDRPPLLAIQPADEPIEHHVKNRHADHCWSLQHEAAIAGSGRRPDRIVGQTAGHGLAYFGRSIRTISEFIRDRSNTMAFPSGVTSKVPKAP